MTHFPTRKPVELEHRPATQSWLVDTLWGEQAVGILGGDPKTGKTFMALDLAIAVASGQPCLRHYPVQTPGPVLLYAAEDAAHIVRARLEGIAHAAQTCFETLDIAIIDTPVMRLDEAEHRQRLANTVSQVRPRVLILDPLVRLHSRDENAVGEIAPILAFLRDLQRSFATAVLLVHHARKSGGNRPGKALRGSGELFAWTDSLAYLQRRKQRIVMTLEHRAAASHDDIELELVTLEHGPALRRVAPAGTSQTTETPRDRILQVLEGADTPLSVRQIRERAGVRNATVSATLEQLCCADRVIRNRHGYIISREQPGLPFA